MLTKRFDFRHTSKVYNLLLKVNLNSQSIAEGVDLSYDVYGNSSGAEPLIISHGLLGSKINWRGFVKNLVPRLTPSREVIVVDNRNHGASPHTNEHNYDLMSLDFLRLMDKLGFDKAHLMGHSMGGRAVALTALTNPERVSSLIVVDVSPISSQEKSSIDDLKTVFDGFKTVDLTELAGPLSKARMQADKMLKNYVPNQPLRNFMLQNLKENEDGSFSWKFNIDTLSNSFYSVRNVPVRMYDLKYDKPTLFVGGELSDYLPKSDEEPIRRMFPNAEFEYVPNAGHLVHMENPEIFTNIVVKYLNTLKI